MTYNYEVEVSKDIMNYILENYTHEELESMTEDGAYNLLYDEMWTEDSVTGNGSGSYTFSSWEAEENLLRNTDLLAKACNEFGCMLGDFYQSGDFEGADVTIRCYLLGDCLSEVLSEIYHDINEG